MFEVWKMGTGKRDYCGNSRSQKHERMLGRRKKTFV
jgi:hypothetical protein